MPKKLPDEHKFTIPSAWRRHIRPSRGSITASRVKIDDAAVAGLRERTDEIRIALENTTGDAGLLDAARAHLGGEASPVGAAVLVKLAKRVSSRRGAAKLDVAAFADLWVVTHGIAFAAEAAVDLARASVDEHGIRYTVACSDPTDWHAALGYGGLSPVVHRVRALLAAADDTDYRAAVTALAGRREHDVERVIAAYLVPTETAWVDDLLATAAGSEEVDREDLLISSVRTTDQLNRVSQRERGLWNLTFPQVMYTVAEQVGPAIAPLLAAQWPHERYDVSKKNVLAVLAALPSDEAFELLVASLDQQHVNAAVRDAAKRYPVRAFRVLTAAASGDTPIAPLAAGLLAEHTTAHPDLVATLPDEVRAALDTADQHQPADRAAEAPLDALPALLVTPPWAVKRTTRKRLVVNGLEPSVEPAIVWEKGERQNWAATNIDWLRKDVPVEHWNQYRGLHEGTYQHSLPVQLFTDAPEEVARPLLASWQPPDIGYSHEWMRVVIARFELDALPVALALIRDDQHNQDRLGRLLLPFVTAEVAELMAGWRRLKDRQHQRLWPVVDEWFRRHPTAAARAFVPASVGKAGTPRRHAEDALRRVAAIANSTAALFEAARHYGDAAVDALRSWLDQESQPDQPAKPPKPGEWLDVHRLPRVLLRGREHALPLSAVEHVIGMLTLSRLDNVHQGIQVVKEHCDPASLAEFAWALYEQSAKEVRFHGLKADWVLPALGLFGDDGTVRRLTPVIRDWHKKDDRKAAVAGLDVLAAIGTDVALVQLNSIAQTVALKSLRYEAQQRLDKLARDRNLSPEQLADRLVPDFGLDATGRLTLDYGPRQFTVGFDEQLKPVVADQDGNPLKALPKPGARDDQDLAPAAYQRFSELKKDVRTVATNQIRRLEQAMITQRRWSSTEFHDLFVHHPLLWHITRRLVWTVSFPGEETGGDPRLTPAVSREFRIAEDRTLANANDDTLTLPDTAQVAVAHPVHLDDSLKAWAEVFADYAILQPFAQLDRPVHRLTEDERTSRELTRFHDITVPTTKVLGLERRGWWLDSPAGNGLNSCLCRSVPENRVVVVNLDPGLVLGAPLSHPEQRIVDVRVEGVGRDHGKLRFGHLDPAICSEVLTDLTDVTALTSE